MTPALAGPGIVLRPLERADAPALFVAMGDPVVQLYRRHAAHTDVDETARYVDDTLVRSRAAWAITTDGGEALGRLALREPESGVGEFGIVIRRAAQRMGLGRQSLELAERYAFEKLAFTLLTADIDAENAASIALFTRAGFAHERTATRVSDRGERASVIMAKRRA